MTTNTTRRLHLHGELGRDLAAPDGTPVPNPFPNAAATPAKMIRLLAAQVPAFRERLQRGRFEIVRGTLGESGALALDERTMHVRLGHTCDVHLIPVIEGEGGRSGKAAAKIVLGVALVGGAIAFAPAGAGLFGANLGASLGTSGLAASITYGNLASIGAGLALPGASAPLGGRRGTSR